MITPNLVKKTIFAGTTALLLSVAPASHADSIEQALKKQPDEAKARYEYRNPKETLEFFKIDKGMTVVEALPGGGWYSKILLPVLGEDGTLIGADYAQSMWSNFQFMTPERIEEKKTWVTTWTEQANAWRSEGDALVNAFKFGDLGEDLKGTADAVLFIRALHNLNRFEAKGGYFTKALADTYAVLKVGGLVGVVQHQALEDRPDEWADGSNGYLKKSKVVEMFESNGFKLIDQTSVNENDQDQANEGDFVWRLPPTFYGSGEDIERKQQMTAIGESNRMTLLFKKIEK